MSVARSDLPLPMTLVCSVRAVTSSPPKSTTLSTMRTPNSVVQSSEKEFIRANAAPTPEMASRMTAQVATVRNAGTARMVPGSLRTAWKTRASRPPTQTVMARACVTSEVIATPCDPSDEAWPVRAGSATATRLTTIQLAAAVMPVVKMQAIAMPRAIRLTMMKPRTLSTDQANVLIMLGRRVSLSG